MIPYLVILVCGVIGLATYGFWGFLVGLGVGWILSMLIGGLSWLARGGLVPRKAKRSAAESFCATYPDLVEQAYSGMTGPEQVKVIENLIERFFRQSAEDVGRVGEESVSLERVMEAADQVCADLGEAEAELCRALREHVLTTMYAPASPLDN